MVLIEQGGEHTLYFYSPDCSSCFELVDVPGQVKYYTLEPAFAISQAEFNEMYYRQDLWLQQAISDAMSGKCRIIKAQGTVPVVCYRYSPYYGVDGNYKYGE